MTKLLTNCSLGCVDFENTHSFVFIGLCYLSILSQYVHFYSFNDSNSSSLHVVKKMFNIFDKKYNFHRKCQEILTLK